ncbi:MAG: DUF2304 family protein [Methanobacteriaceae archaeon]|nr:DUF2304 family protein [Methanobacteriaceae archaeon]
MIIYQYIGLLIGIVGVLFTLIRFKDKKMTFNMLLVWATIWLLLIIFSIYPNTTSILANITGIGRGLDLILILGLISCFYLIFKIYNMIENIEEEITILVREMALESKKIDNKGKNGKEESTDKKNYKIEEQFTNR